jgi:hypothetical protein
LTRLPNDPNEHANDAHQAGWVGSCAITNLPAAPSKRVNKATPDFLRGFVASGYRNDALNKAAC